jgi:hypothetical protein
MMKKSCENNFKKWVQNVPSSVKVGTFLLRNPTVRAINGENVVKIIKAQRIRWLGHVKRMEVGAMPRKMLERRLLIGGRKGIPRLRWMEDIVEDLGVIKIKQ